MLPQMNADKRRLLGMSLLLLALAFPTHYTFAVQDKQTPPKQLDLNSATAEELDRLPEVGPKLAEAIVRFRLKSGPFRRVEELRAVPGITKRRLEKIRPHVYVKPKQKQEKKQEDKPTGSDARPASRSG